MLRALATITTATFFALGTAAQAEDWPARPITMINPFAAGGPNDVLARLFAQRMGELLGQPVVLENVGGAGGMNGADRVAKAAPDGYTFLLGTVGTQAQNQTLFKKPAYNSTTDFEPVALVVEAPLVLVARKDFSAKDMKEFVAYTKANESKMQFGSAGTGSAIHWMRVDEFDDRPQRRACALSRGKSCDAGSDEWPDRLPVRYRNHGEASN